MLKHFRNLVILLVILVIAGVGYLYFLHGDTARLTLDETSGVEPKLSNVRPERIPTINVAEADPWNEGEGPIAAEGLTVERFAEGLDHPRDRKSTRLNSSHDQISYAVFCLKKKKKKKKKKN